MNMEAMNVVLITSVINPPNRPLSYCNHRSIYSPEERFIQTQKTISSIRDKIPNSKIFFLECSQLTPEQTEYLTKNSEYFINLFNQDENQDNTADTFKQVINNDIYGISKALGEGTMTIKALEYIKKHIIPDIINRYNITINHVNFFKISGRYWLTDNFDYHKFNDTTNAIFKKIENNPNNIFTALFKLPGKMIDNLYNFLTDGNNMNKMRNCIGYEVLFSQFIREISNLISVEYIDPIGLSGFVTIDGSFYNG